MTYDQRHNINILQPERHWLMPQGIVDFDADVIASNPLVYWNAQELTGSVLGTTYNPAVALGRNVVLNPTFDDWAGDDPVSWAATESNPNSDITENPAGKCNLISTDGTLARIKQTILVVGKTNKVTVVVDSISGAGSIVVRNSSTNHLTITTTGTKTVTFTATANGELSIQTNGVVNAVVSLVNSQQTGILASSAYPGAELLSEAGDGTADKDNWDVVNNATLTNPSTGVLKVARDGTNNPIASQSVLVAGTRNGFVLQARSDGNATPRLVDGAGTLWSGTTSTDWQSLDAEFVNVGALVRLMSITSTGTEYTEWRTISVTEANPLNGDDTGTALGTATGTNLGVARTFDGTTSLINIYSATLNSMFKPDAGTLIAYAKVSGAGVWTDGINRGIVNLGINSDNRIRALKLAANNSLAVLYKSQGTVETISHTISSVGWLQIAMTWEFPGNLTMYVNGVSVGTPQAIANVLVGNFDSTLCVIGALTSAPANVWDGDITQIPLYDRALTPAEILSQYQKAGI